MRLYSPVRGLQAWNFRCEPVAPSNGTQCLLPDHKQTSASSSSSSRKRKFAVDNRKDDGVGGEGASGAFASDGSIFTNALKRTKILGGVSVSTDEGVGNFGSGTWGGGSWGGAMGGMHASLVAPKWAQLPLGALTTPAPTAASAISPAKTAFHPVYQVNLLWL
jgi:hypothetical protein